MTKDAVNKPFFERHRALSAVVGCIMVLAYVICYLLFGSATLNLFPDANPVIASIVAGVLFGGVSLALFRRNLFGIRPEEDTENEFNPLYWVMMFAIMTVALEGIFLFINSRVADPGLETRVEFIEESGILAYTVLAVVIAPVVEELIFRVFCYHLLKKMWSMFPAMIFTSVLFGIVHGTLAHLVTATMLGIFFCLSCEYTGKWYVSILGHFLYNVITVFFLNDWFKQEAVQPYFFLMCVLLYIVVTVYLGMDVIHKGEHRLRSL